MCPGFERSFACICGATFGDVDRPEPLRSLSASSQVNDSMRPPEADCEGCALMMARPVRRPCPPERMFWISDRPQPLGQVRSVGAPGQLDRDGPPKGSPENDTLRKVEDHDGVGKAEDELLRVVRVTIEDPAAGRDDDLDRGVELRRVLRAQPIALHDRKATERSQPTRERGLATAGTADDYNPLHRIIIAERHKAAPRPALARGCRPVIQNDGHRGQARPRGPARWHMASS